MAAAVAAAPAADRIDGYEFLFDNLNFKLKLKDVRDAYIQLSDTTPLRITASRDGESAIVRTHDGTISLVLTAHPEEEMGMIRMRRSAPGGALLAYPIPTNVLQRIVALVIARADPEGAADPVALSGGRRHTRRTVRRVKRSTRRCLRR